MAWSFEEGNRGTVEQAQRSLRLGGPVRWQMRAASETSDPLVLIPDSHGHCMLGSPTFDGKPVGGACALVGESAANASVVEGECVADWEREPERPRRHWSERAGAGEILNELSRGSRKRITPVLDQELGEVPYFLQDGDSNLDCLGQIAWAVTGGLRSAARSQPGTVVLSGSDGGGWQLVPLHNLAQRSLPEPEFACDPSELVFDVDSTGWEETDFAVPTSRTSSVIRLAASREVALRPEFLGRRSERSVLPLALPRNMVLRDDGVSAEFARRPERYWVVGIDEVFSASGYRVTLYVAANPAQLVRPRPPRSRGAVILRGTVAEHDGKADRWTVPCLLHGLEESGEARVALTTPYAGENGTAGLHFVPAPGTGVLVGWSGRPWDFPFLAGCQRPAQSIHADGSALLEESDARALGPLSVLLERDQDLEVRLAEGELNISASELSALARGRVNIETAEDEIRLQNNQGRRIKIGGSYVDVD